MLLVELRPKPKTNVNAATYRRNKLLLLQEVLEINLIAVLHRWRTLNQSKLSKWYKDEFIMEVNAYFLDELITEEWWRDVLQYLLINIFQILNSEFFFFLHRLSTTYWESSLSNYFPIAAERRNRCIPFLWACTFYSIITITSTVPA